MEYRMNNDFFDEFTALFTKKESVVMGKHRPLGHYADQVLDLDSAIRDGEVMEPSEAEPEGVEFSFPVQLSYEVVRKTGKAATLAERMCFTDLAGFLNVDLHKGMAAGNLPRRCRNCGRFFLAIGGYDTVYCNEVAPGEEKRTCRMVGAHKAEKLKTRSTFALNEYDRVYNRLKQRKRRGSISVEEWNRLVAQAQELKEAALRGEVSDVMLLEAFNKI